MATARPNTWMPIYWGDYAKDTGHLSAAHHGAYLMLIKHYWVTGKALPIDDAQLWRIACADSLAHWRKLKPVVLSFFEQRDGALYHGRVEKELQAAGEHAERRAEMARRASRARWGQNGGSNPAGTPPGTPPGNAPRIPDAMPGQSPPPSPSPDVTTTESVADNARPRATQPADGLDPPQFLRRPRAVLIPDDWQPSENALMNLRKGRPDLVGKLYDDRMQDFREWCRANAVTSHDPEASWSSFMRKTRTSAPAGETHDQRRIREAREAIAS